MNSKFSFLIFEPFKQLIWCEGGADFLPWGGGEGGTQGLITPPPPGTCMAITEIRHFETSSLPPYIPTYTRTYDNYLILSDEIH